MMTGNYLWPDHHRLLLTFRSSVMLVGCFMTKRVLQVITFHLYVHHLGTPVASVNAMHSSAAAAAAQSDDTGGLEPIASGAHVMLTVNLHNKSKSNCCPQTNCGRRRKTKARRHHCQCYEHSTTWPLGRKCWQTDWRANELLHKFAGQEISRQETTLCSKACSEWDRW